MALSEHVYNQHCNDDDNDVMMMMMMMQGIGVARGVQRVQHPSVPPQGDEKNIVFLSIFVGMRLKWG